MQRMGLVGTEIPNIMLQVCEFELQISTFYNQSGSLFCLVNNTHDKNLDSTRYELGKASKMVSTVTQSLGYFASFQYSATSLHDPVIFVV